MGNTTKRTLTPEVLERARRVYDFIRQNPGATPARITRELGLKPGQVDTIIMQTENAGLLLAEHNGGLYAMETRTGEGR